MEKNEVLRRTLASTLSTTLSAMEAGQDAVALAALENAERQIGTQEELLYARGLVLIRLGRKAEARSALEAALRGKPGDAAIQTLLQSLPAESAIPVATEPQASTPPATAAPHAASGPYAIAGPTPLSLVHFATSPELWDDLLAFHGELATDPYVRMVDGYYRECRSRFGKHWHYLDAVNTVFAAAKWGQPRHYLEIGVRRGRTACTVARACPSVEIHAFDMWIQGYAGMDNPGPDFVRQELRKHGHTGKVNFTDGDSHVTVPAYLRAHPDLEFDLILVDGDHSEEGALADLLTVLPRLRKGGVIAFDDIVHPAHPYLLKVWRKAMEKHVECQSHEYTEAGYGIAFAVRKG
jgi:predicted O-methyltransferase YrrM